ncbi:hypothetical protein DRI50_03015 [candidate division KSB1 bacterium]|nr:MAG: hypothetical protein DRI50_03015 [candidate division KSB1 bacterium]
MRFVLTLIALAISFSLLVAQVPPQQTTNVPPVLTVPQGAPLPVAPGTPPPPAPQAVPPGPPSPPGVPGIPVAQTIPLQTLTAQFTQARETALQLNKLLLPGKVWFMRAPGGELEVKAGLTYQGVVVALLRFDPQTGQVLPAGVNPHVYTGNLALAEVKKSLSAIAQRLKILPVAEFLEPEACWSFPVTYQNFIVAHVKIYYDGIHVVQDYPANQEMSFYGQ